MKIKKVRIQAFRSYLDVNDGTFDFSDNKGKPANIVSIFAPNGFGKTSFCDAVDFAITGKIHRHSRMKQIEKFYKNEAVEGNKIGERQFVLRNKFAPETMETSVTVEVNNRDKPIIGSYQAPRTNSSDFHPEKAAKEGSAFFEYAMLYQEAIDSILRETNPEDRFSKFAENDSELSDLNSKRAALIVARNEIIKESDIFEEKKGSLQEKIKGYGEKQRDLTVINRHLTAINELLEENKIELFDVSQGFDQRDADKLEQSLISLQQYLKVVIRDTTQEKSRVISHQSKLASYVEFNAQKELVERELKVITSVQVQIEEINEIETSCKELKAKQDKYLSVIKLLDLESMNIGDYFRLKSALTTKGSELVKVEEDKQKIIASYSLQLEEVKSAEDSLKEVERKKGENLALLEQVNSIYSDIKRLEGNQFTHQKTIKELGLKKNDLMSLIEDVNSIQSELEETSLDRPISREHLLIQKEIFKETILKDFDTYQILESNVESQKAVLNEKNQELAKLNTESKMLEELLSKAHSVILESQQSECPVCRQPYEDFSTLEARLKQNPVYEGARQILAESIQEIKQTLTKYEREKFLLANKFEAAKSNAIEKLNEEKQDYLGKLRLTEKSSNDLAELLTNENSELAELKSKVSFKEKSVYEKEIDNDNKELVNKIEKAAKQLNDEKAKLNKLKHGKDELLQDLTTLSEELAHLKIELSAFDSLVRLMAENNWLDVGSGEAIKSNFQKKADELRSFQRQNDEKITEYNARTKELKEQMPFKYRGSSGSDLERLCKEHLNKLVQLSESLNPFKVFLELINCPDSQKKDTSAIEKLAGSKITELDKKLENVNSGVSDAKTVEALAAALVGTEGLTFLEKEVKEVQRKLDCLTQVEKELDSDICKFGNLIHEKIDSFFKTELINQIYHFIDPHPEFKKIRFECVTENDKPKLFIKAESEDRTELVSPILIFSAAQVNVLALSIFLAKALCLTDNKGAPVNCIFIDDPVQSIDSINTLSLIDLLRVIAIEYDKQIIVTTHDENFHDLLKRKMPSDLFSSRFMRLESFGKVRLDTN